jgi:hypothetical protein
VQLAARRMVLRRTACACDVAGAAFNEAWAAFATW